MYQLKSDEDDDIKLLESYRFCRIIFLCHLIIETELAFKFFF